MIPLVQNVIALILYISYKHIMHTHHAYTFIYPGIHLCTYVGTYTYTNTYVYSHRYTYMHIDAYIHEQAYIHTYIVIHT